MKNGSGVEAERANTAFGKAQEQAYSAVRTSLLKRCLDLLIAVSLLIVTSPFILIAAILIKLEDGGPVLFSHARTGLGGKTFGCLKLRTMHIDAQERLDELLKNDPNAAAEWAEYQKLENDPRVTRIGKFLRRTSLDELPQLWSIIRGEMSMIGPRPVTEKETYRYGANLAYYTAARPGVLGLWQVNGRNSLNYEQRIAYDVQYVREWSIGMDIGILLKAIPVVLLGRNAG